MCNLLVFIYLAKRKFAKGHPEAVSPLFVVNAVLLLRWLQLYLEAMRRLVYVVVLAEGLKSAGKHLDAQFAVGNSVEARLAIGVGLQLHSALVLFPVLVDGMKDYASVAHRLAGFFLQNDELEVGGFLLGKTCERKRRERK